MKRYIILILFLLLTLTACGEPYDYTQVDHGTERDTFFTNRVRWIEAGGDRLQYVKPYANETVTVAHVQRYRDGDWWDIGMTVPVSDWITLDLTDGYYRLVYPLSEQEYAAYDFGVGSLAELSSRDLPAGRETVAAVDVSFKPIEGPNYPDQRVIAMRETYGEHTNYQPHFSYFEIRLDGKWCSIPCHNDINSVNLDGPNQNVTIDAFYGYITYEDDTDSSFCYYFPLVPGEYHVVGSTVDSYTTYVATPSFTIVEGRSDAIVNEFTQRYDYEELRAQEGIFRAVAAGTSSSLEPQVGLQAGNNRLTVTYMHPVTGEFWLECYALNAAEAAVVRERKMPLGEWLTNAVTPENRAELILEAADGKLYAAALCSKDFTEEEMLQRAKTVYVWLPGGAEPVAVSCTDEEPMKYRHSIPWEQSGTPDDFRVEAKSPIEPDGTWRLQRLTNGRWYDMDQCGEGLSYDDRAIWGSVDLELPAGEYRLMLRANMLGRGFAEIPYYFRAP